MPPHFKQCAVLLDSGKVVYRKGEKVKGKVVLDVTQPLTVMGVRVYCYGQALVKWTSNNPLTPSWDNESVATEKYLGLVITLFGKKPNVPGPNVQLTSGRHAYPFCFQLPSDLLPSSYEGHYGAIRYWLKVEVQIPWPSLNKTWHRCFTVLDTLDVNEPRFRAPVRRESQKTVSKTLGLGHAGTLSLSACLDRSAYCPGEVMLLHAEVRNGSDKILGRLQVQLCQKVVFSANNKTQTRTPTLRSLDGGPAIQAGETRVWANYQLPVDAVPPSTTPRSCHVITVSYHVKVSVELPFQFNLSVELPVTIGTVPRGLVSRDRAAAVPGSIPVLDARGQVTYTPCSKGVEQCQRWDGLFPNLTFTPMTAFVPDFSPPPPIPVPYATPTAPPQPTPCPAPKTLPKATPSPTAPPAGKQKASPGSSVGVAAPSAAASLGACTSVPQRTSLPEVGVVAPEDRPPSYEEATRAAPTQGQAVNEAPIYVLALRFPDTRLAAFRHTLETGRLQLSQSGGKLVALSPQPVASEGIWPPHTALALLRFTSEDGARAWFSSFSSLPAASSASTASTDTWRECCHAFLKKLKSDFNDSWKIFTLGFSTLKKGLSAREINAAVKGLSVATQKLRASLNGQLLTSGRGHSMLTGSWLQEAHMVTLTQWEMVYGYGRYVFVLKQGDLASLYTKMRNVVEDTSGLLFQTEDLSAFQVDQDETVNEVKKDVTLLGQEVSSAAVANTDHETDVSHAPEGPPHDDSSVNCGAHDVTPADVNEEGHDVTTGDDADDASPGLQDSDDATPSDDADDVTPDNETSQDELRVDDADVTAQSAATQESSTDAAPDAVVA